MVRKLIPGSLLRVRRVAELLDVSRQHVYRLIHQRDIDAVRVGPRQIRVTADSIDRYMLDARANRPAYPDSVDVDVDDPRSNDPDAVARRLLRDQPNQPTEGRISR